MSIEQPIAPATLDERMDAVFGDNADPMTVLEERAAELLDGHDAIVWECDASTFVFSFVSASAERVLGWRRSRWTDEPTFWADVVVHGDDRDPAVTYCATETGECRDHDFGYRAVTADGRVVRLRDVVRVLLDAEGRPERLRGIMFPVADA